MIDHPRLSMALGLLLALTGLTHQAAAQPLGAQPSAAQQSDVRKPGPLPAFAPAQSGQSDPHLPPGLQSARLLPGWTDGAGNRVMALELQLAPGWKTYWRSPGDTGLPPHFDWQGGTNLRDVTLHWPAPQAIDSGGMPEMGYNDRLILPFTARPADPGQPVQVRALIDLGLCENICVPASLDLVAPPPGDAPDPAITAALAAEPQRLDHRPACRVTEIEDGLSVAMDLPPQGAALAAIELTGHPEVWVSGARIAAGPAGPEAVVQMVGPSGRPFDLDPAALRMTVIPEDGARATETMGCAPAG
ncbi:protein-disulfide reductase DsbD domain-containing protein [Paracoccus nototheniae]|uniref:Protein-disulfide reductase DsbD domain-containing protein n=1 Tax=Paracoccus nototheniae TaxID=2489002 RepID=A0ABW4DRN1_9RHOB|nr:protein-disulfide reductase DsbD domain-containing protein [Paracoccus nototheniae]